METETPHITGSYQTSMREYLSHVPALNRGTRFSIGFGVLALLLAVLSLPYLVPVAIELALAVALLSGYYAVPFTWLTLRSRREQVEQTVECSPTMPASTSLMGSPRSTSHGRKSTGCARTGTASS